MNGLLIGHWEAWLLYLLSPGEENLLVKEVAYMVALGILMFAHLSSL